MMKQKLNGMEVLFQNYMDQEVERSAVEKELDRILDALAERLESEEIAVLVEAIGKLVSEKRYADWRAGFRCAMELLQSNK